LTYSTHQQCPAELDEQQYTAEPSKQGRTNFCCAIFLRFPNQARQPILTTHRKSSGLRRPPIEWHRCHSLHKAQKSTISPFCVCQPVHLTQAGSRQSTYAPPSHPSSTNFALSIHPSFPSVPLPSLPKANHQHPHPQTQPNPTQPSQSNPTQQQVVPVPPSRIKSTSKSRPTPPAPRPCSAAAPPHSPS
jgi:hypothetical protein